MWGRAPPPRLPRATRQTILFYTSRVICCNQRCASDDRTVAPVVQQRFVVGVNKPRQTRANGAVIYGCATGQ